MSTSDALSIAATSDVPVVDQALKRGNRALALRQYEEAVQAYGEASQLLGEQLGEDAPEYADVLVLYGRALLQNAVEQNGVLGQDATAMASTAEDNADDAATAPVLAKLLQFMGDAELDDDDDEEEEEEEEKDEKESEDNNDAKEGDDNQEEQKDNKEEGEEEQDEEPSDDFGMAWEILDLARVIYAREDNEESKEKLGDVYMLLGDVSLESENFDQAYKDYEDALQIKQALYKPDDRRLAEAHYKYALGCEYTNRKEDAIEQLRCVAHVLQQRLKHLRQDEDTNESKSTDKGKQPMSALSSQSDNAQEAEMADILNLLVEVDTKMEELAQKPVINTDPLTDAVLKDTTAPTTSKLVNDITMLVRSTKKQTTSDESAAKRKADEETIDTTSGDEKRTKSQRDE